MTHCHKCKKLKKEIKTLEKCLQISWYGNIIYSNFILKTLDKYEKNLLEIKPQYESRKLRADN